MQYVVAHGIASSMGGEKVVIGSQHFVFEDEGCYIPTSESDKFDALPPQYSHLYLAIDGELAGVICIADRCARKLPMWALPSATARPLRVRLPT